MKRRRMVAILGTACVAIACGTGGKPAAGGAASGHAARAVSDTAPEVMLVTSKGRIVIRLDRARAPVTVANFLKHVRGHFYDGLIFHRVKPGFVIQAGAYTPTLAHRISQVFPIENEADNGLKNVRGAVAMARTGDPNSATSEFFIDLSDNPRLDHRDNTAQGWGYAVFGAVVQGMNVVDDIALVPTKREAPFEALPLTPVVIDSAFVLPDSARVADRP